MHLCLLPVDGIIISNPIQFFDYVFIFYILIFENELDIEGPNPAIDSTGERQACEVVMSSHLDSPFIWLS